MGENIIFALSATVPLFLMMALGFFIKRIKIVDDSFIKTANSFNFKVTIPAMLFADMATADFKKTFDLKFLLFCMIGTCVAFWGLWGLTKLFMKDKASVAEFVQGGYRCSLAVNGVALVESISGNTAMAGMMMLGTVPLYNIFATILLQAESPLVKEKSIKPVLISIAKNPLIIAILAGTLSSLIGITYPAMISTALNYAGRIGTPFALICIGADFDFKKAFGKIGKSGLSSAVKILILPTIFVILAIFMGFRGEQLAAIMVCFGGPTTPVSYVMAKQYGHEGTISSSTVALTTLFSSVSMTLFIFVLRTVGYI